MGKKDKKSKTAEQKARLAARQSKKVAQKEKKGRFKGDEDSDADDIDLESVLEDYAKRQAQFLKVTEKSCDPPSSRSSATLLGSPINNKELFLFGGEYFNGTLATFFNDLFVYHIEKDEWRRVTSPNSPLPRSGHAWCRGGNSGDIYLFGGEFSSPKQGTFYHYNDFWRLDPSNREWEKLDSKGKGPPARSGHRMTYYKNHILLFGGFQDTSSSTKYLQDLWIYDCQTLMWHNMTIPAGTQKPDARSSFSFLPHEGGAVMYGGYSRVKSTALAGKQAKGGTQAVRSVTKPMLHQDTWFLRITRSVSEDPGSNGPSIRWERRKKPANAPNPSRAGATMAYHKGRGILFGGVHDVEECEEGIESEFFDALFAWNIERNRYFQLTLRRPRTAQKTKTDERSNMRRGRGKADEAELLRNLAALGTKVSTDDTDMLKTQSAGDLDTLPTKAAKEVIMTMPHSRFNAQLAVQDDVLYIFGGTYENGDREYTFDEMWAIDLGKLDGVREIYRREPENWQDSDEEDGSSDSNEGESEDDDLEGDVPMGVPLISPTTDSLATPKESHTWGNKPEIEAEEQETAAADDRPHPRAFESLRDFFARTSNLWQDMVLKALREKASAPDQSVKDLRKTAFEMAERTWWDCREEVTALEDEQEEAGIGEVLSIADRTSAEGVWKRR